ncbi:MAG TPA: hypothetical protein VEV16_09025 [Daejeonella sp.]|nr:hypothetical protein [Daejeonella sp.]
MKNKIENIDDLRSEILRLKLQQFHHEAAIEQDIKHITDKLRIPSLLLGKFNEWFGSQAGGLDQATNEHDWVTNAFRVGLPVLLNKLIFKRAGFFMKSLVALASQHAANTVNRDVVSHWVDKVTGWVRGVKEARKNRKTPDYGIPPDSETY